MTRRNDQSDDIPGLMPHENESHWHWRHRMAEHIAAELDPDIYGVVAIYLLGSTRNATAGPASDIDLLIHFRGSGRQREDLVRWLDTWSRRLSEMNCQRTGCRTDGLLDAHIVTDADIEQKTSYTIKIGAVTDPALPLKTGPGMRVRSPAPSSRQ